jgi:hypothetical protein
MEVSVKSGEGQDIALIDRKRKNQLCLDLLIEVGDIATDCSVTDHKGSWPSIAVEAVTSQREGSASSEAVQDPVLRKVISIRVRECS